MSFANLTPKVHVKYFAPCCYSTVSLIRHKVQTELPLMYGFWKNPRNGMQTWVGHSQSSSNNDLRRLRMSQWLLILQDISICSAAIRGAGQAGRAERYVPEPGGRRKISVDAKGKVVDFPTLQCVAGVILVSLVPGQDASFMLWSCWTHVKCVKPQYYNPMKEQNHWQPSCYFLTRIACSHSLEMLQSPDGRLALQHILFIPLSILTCFIYFYNVV